MSFQLATSKYTAPFVGVFITVLVVFIYLANSGILAQALTRLDYAVYDFRYNILLPVPIESDTKIVIVDLDELSLAKEGRWPWSRKKIADLVAKIVESGALVIGFDMVFSESEENIVSILLNDSKVSDAARTELLGLESDYDFNRVLANSLEGDTILAYIFHEEKGVQVGQLPEPIMKLAEGQSQYLAVPAMTNFSATLPYIQDKALSAGYVTIIPDEDGVIRRSQLLLQHNNALFSSFALEIARQYLLVNEVIPQFNYIGEVQVLESIQLDRIRIPTDEKGQMIIPYKGKRGSFPYVSASSVLNGELQGEELDSAIVLIGASALALADLKTTTLGPGFPGVEVHANIINAILNQSTNDLEDNNLQDNNSQSKQQGGVKYRYQIPYKLEQEKLITTVVLVVLGFLLAFIQPRLGPMTLIMSSFILLFFFIAGNFYLWRRYSLDTSVSAYLMLVILVSTANFAEGFLRETSQRLKIKKMFGQYVPSAHVDKMLASGDDFSFAGESKEMSVMFSDIRSFTTISEGLSAVDLKSMLNRFFTPITQIIFDNGGTIDKYVGDMVMAFWGAPLDDEFHAENAIKAGLRMLEEVERLKEEFKNADLPEINVGIGINTGLMNVGDMGSSYRRAYTVLGDAVNLGSRLEGVTKFYGAKLLIGEKTQEQSPSFLCRTIDRIRVKGKTEPITVYEPLCYVDDASEELQDQVARFHLALDHYFFQRWDEATRIILKLKKDDPSCHLFTLYLNRIHQLRFSNLSVDWDGVYTHITK